MCGRRSALLSLALVALQASASGAQTAPPWTGIAGDEARPATTLTGFGDPEMTSHSMSGDGRFVVFYSGLALVYDDTNNWHDVFLRDRQTGELRRVSVASDGSQGNHYSAFASISSNGRHIAFNSCATNLDPADTNDSCDLFIHDRELATTVRASLGPNGEQATITTQHHFNLSADGRYFVFNAGFGGNQRRVWLRDRDTDGNGVFDEPGTAITTLVSHPDVGSSGFEDEEVAISHDGRWIAYNALTWDSSGAPVGTRLYLYDRIATTTVRVDLAMAGGVDISAYSGGPDFSETGHLAYSSNADNLAEGDTDGADDIYVYDIATGVNTPIELTHPGAPALDAEWAPAISADGRFVAFTGAQYGQGWNAFYNVYAVDRQTGLSSEISVWPDGARDDDAGAASISADGAAIAFAAGPEMLPNAWGNDGVFVVTNVALSPPEIEVPAEGGTFTIEVTMPAGVAWILNTAGAPGAEFSQTSGVGPATIDVTLWDNGTGEEQDYYVLLGTEQVILHQTVRPWIWALWPYEGGPEGGTEVQIFGEAFVDGAAVAFDGISATNVVVIDSETIMATTPAHAGLGWVSVTVTNPSGVSGTLEQGFWYRDVTPPVVTYEIGGTPGSNGWYTSDVWVTWNYEDPESTVFLMGCNNPYLVSSDTASEFVLCSVTSEGGDTFAQVEIKRDTLPPIIAISPSIPETYFQGQVVPIAHYCSDYPSGSGIATCTPNQAGPNLDTSAVGTFEFSVTAVDAAGHSTTTATSYTVKMVSEIGFPTTTAVYGDATAALRATLVGGGSPQAGKTITLFVDNVSVGTAITSATGELLLNVSLDGRSAGTYPLRAEFAGDESALPTIGWSNLILEKATPVLAWTNPTFITHGTALSGAQLNATSSVAGAFGYNPDFGTVLPPGTHTLTAQLAPQDSTNYNAGSKSVTLKVKAVPVITWATPPPLEYPYSLSGTHLNATADVPGTFVYSPIYGWQLPAGTHTLSVTFTPANQADYTTATASVTLEVLKGTPTLTWVPEGGVYYGNPLDASQLNATASTAGTFGYDPPAGTVLPAGTHTLTVVFTPTNANYNPATKSVSLVVGKYPTGVNWDFPAPISYGTPLGPVQQNATSNVPGTFTYYPPPGTILEIGQHWVSVSLTPDDPANYETGWTYASITVDIGQSTVSWSDPAPIVYPQSLQWAQLNATASLPGTFNYSPGFGTVLPAGTHTLHVAFTPTDSAHYFGASKDVSIVVAKRAPAITWNDPAGLTYGTALSAAQLNATANVPGTFAYSPAMGTVLGAGTHALSVTFTPTDTANNLPATASTSITVAAATPVVSWTNPSGIEYGTALSAAELNATANVPGTFDYSPSAGAVLAAGTQALSVTFTPTDAANYTTATDGVSIVIAKATPVVSWTNPSGIQYGTALSSTQLNATANVPGTFNYSPAAGTVLNAGTQPLSVTFTPADSANYADVTSNVSIVVAPAASVVTWANPAGVTYGTALSATQLNATANVAGTFAYSPADGTVLNAGTHALSVTFTPADSINYNTATAGVSIEVGKLTPAISWTTPSGIIFGTALSGTQLNATANVPGTFAYSPSAGAVLNAGTQQLSVTFTPADAVNYNNATAGVSIVVAKATPVVTWANPAGITYGTALSASQLNATANVAGTFAYLPAAGTVLNAGTQPLSVTFTPADGANYNASAAAASIVIAPAALTVQANNSSKVYGQALPAFTASGTGLVNGDSMASLSGALAFATSATATSAPGAYAVTPSGLSSANYTITFAAGALTVTKAATSLELTTTPNPSKNNQSVELRAVVSAVAPGAGIATGTIEFREDGTLVGTAPIVNGIATLNKNFKKGTHPLTATYVGDGNFTGSSGGVTHQVP